MASKTELEARFYVLAHASAEALGNLREARARAVAWGRMTRGEARHADAYAETMRGDLLDAARIAVRLGPLVAIDYCPSCHLGWYNTTGELPGACPGCGRELINVGMGRVANCDGSYAPPARAPR